MSFSATPERNLKEEGGDFVREMGFAETPRICWSPLIKASDSALARSELMDAKNIQKRLGYNATRKETEHV